MTEAIGYAVCCPFCGRSDEVVYLSRVRRKDRVVAQRWVCRRCHARFAEVERRLLKGWILLALAGIVLSLPTVWWHRRALTPAGPKKFFH